MSERVIAQVAGTVHESIQVVERDGLRFMRFGPRGGWQGAAYVNGRQGQVFPYQRAFASLVRSLSDVDSYLALGVGTGTSFQSVQTAFPNSSLIGLELDERVVDLAIHHFGAPNHTRATYWIGDGVLMLCHVDLTVDLLFVDAYLENQVYGATLQQDFIRVLHAATSEHGVAVCNLITRFPLPRPLTLFLTAARRQFAAVTLLPVGAPLPFAEQNVLCVLAKDEHVVRQWRKAMAVDRDLTWLERWWWPQRMREFTPRPMV